MAYDLRSQATDAGIRSGRPFEVYKLPNGRWDYRDETRPETVEERIQRVLSEPHHPSVCPSKGMFGRDCSRCDGNVKPNNKTRRVPVSSALARARGEEVSG